MKGKFRFQIGLRTVKTAAAVILAMVLVEPYGTSASKLIFAMLGAMAAVQTTFKTSLESCLTQIVGVLFGALVGVGLLAVKLPPLLAAGIGIVLVITLYNTLKIRFSPSLPCFIVVMLCTTPDIRPMTYAVERIWDTAIGLAVGMAINMLVFPYDNSRKIRQTAQSLEQEVLRFLEDLFDGDTHMPEPTVMEGKIQELTQQLEIFSGQRLLLRRKGQKRDLETFRLCQGKARELVARMEILSHMTEPGRLSPENLERLRGCGAQVAEPQPGEEMTERDVVTNYHVRQILDRRRELLEVLGE